MKQHAESRHPNRVEQFIDLDRRLDAASTTFQSDKRHPTSRSSANLHDIPNLLRLSYRKQQDSQSLLTLTLSYLDPRDEEQQKKRLPAIRWEEGTNVAEVAEENHGFVVQVWVGERTGRIYKLILVGMDPMDDDVGKAAASGIAASFTEYVETHKPPVRARAIFLALSKLFADAIPDLFRRVRKGISKPPEKA